MKPGMACYDRIILILLGLIVSLPIIIKTRQGVPKATSTGFSVVSSSSSFVRVGGDVRNPGMYRITVRSVTNDVIKMAIPSRPLKTLTPTGIGGLKVTNGAAICLTITPDGRGRLTVTPIPACERIIMGIPLDINAMNEADFDALPGIGPVMAERIIMYRQRNGGKMTLQELLNIEGIGEKKYGQIKKLF
jgi:competence protein ComEA